MARKRTRKPRKPRKPRVQKPAVSSRYGAFELWRLSWPTTLSDPLPFPEIGRPYFLRTVSVGGLGQVGFVAEFYVEAFDGAGNTVAFFGIDPATCLAPTSQFLLTLSDSLPALQYTTAVGTVPCSQGAMPPSFLILPTMRWRILMNTTLGLLALDGASVMIEYLPLDPPALPVAP